MKNIYKEVQNLKEKYNDIKLSGKELVVYSHNKKNPIIAFVLLLLGEWGLHRFYLGDKFSKIYGLFWVFICTLRKIVLFDYLHRTWEEKLLGMFYNDTNNWSFLAWSIVIITIGMYIVDLFLIIPTTERNNILLKKNLSETPEKVHDAGHYEWWTYIAVLLVFFRLRYELHIASLGLVKLLVWLFS